MRQVPLFEDPEFDEARDLAGLAPDVARFVRDMRAHGGALIELGEGAPELCDRAVAETDPLLTREGRVHDAWRRSPAVRRLALWPKVHAYLRAAYGREPFAFQTLNFRQGSQQHAHSDMIHFSSLPERFMCGVWIALEDVKPGSGPLVYYEGSHRLPVATMRDVGFNGGAATHTDYERHYEPRFGERMVASGLPRHELLIPKGWAFVWAANLAHGGSAITDAGSTRRSLVVHCYFEDGYYFTPMFSDMEAGRLKPRLPPDIRTGWWRWPKREGRRAAVPWRSVAAALWRDLAHRPRG